MTKGDEKNLQKNDISKRLKELEGKAGNLKFKLQWTDREGTEHFTTFEKLLKMNQDFLPDLKNGPLPPDACPIKSVNMDSLAKLPQAQHMAACNFLMWMGFPAMEPIDSGNVWQSKSGTVTAPINNKGDSNS